MKSAVVSVVFVSLHCFFCFFFFSLSLSVFISLLRYQTFLVLQNIAPLTSGLSQ